MEVLRCPLAENEETAVHICNGILLCCNKELNPLIYHMDGSRGSFVNGKESGTERQIQHILFCRHPKRARQQLLDTKKISLFLFSSTQQNNNLRAKSRKGHLALGIQFIKMGRPDSWGSSLGGEILWCDLSYLYRKKQSQPVRLKLHSQIPWPTQLGPVTRGFHNQPRKHHYLGNGFKYMSLLGAVHFQTTTEGYTPGEIDGNLLTDLKKQVGKKTKFKYPCHSRVTTVCRSLLVIL